MSIKTKAPTTKILTPKFATGDDVVGEQTLYTTKNYKKFKVMKGNRDINQDYVNQLKSLMVLNGNLTYERPVEVTADGEVLDGQHRLAALRGLGWEVCYVIQQDATIETVRAINRGAHNWNWRDIAESYAKLGNKHYVWFLEFIDKYGISFYPALRICNGKNTRRAVSSGFQGGDFTMTEEGKKEAYKMAQIINQISRVTGVKSGEFLYAVIRVSKSVGYNHDRMLEKLEKLGDTLPEKAIETDYLRRLEDIYNHGYSEENKTRLF